MKRQDHTAGSVLRAFFKYVVPSVLAFALSGVYAIVDGFFVGRSVGDIGLSAINVAFPVVSLIQSLGTGIGMGGAVLWSLRRGERDGTADSYLRATLWMLLFASVLMTAFYFVNAPVLRLFGAEGGIFEMGIEYLNVIVLGAVFQVFATGLVPAIRNNGGAVFAFLTMLSGFGANIVLDYVFVWVLEGGTEGAALATVLGQAVTAVEAFLYFIVKKLPLFGSFRRFLRCAASIVRVGVAPFGLTLSPMISLMLINKFCMLRGGERAVAAYACIAYAVTIVQMLVQGVGDGSQPLISQYFGEGSPEKSAKVRRLAYLAALLLALLCGVVLFLLREFIGPFFGSSEEVAEDVAAVLPVFLFGLLFYAFSRVVTAGFYATERTLFSYLAVYSEPALMLVLLFILPVFWGQTGVWWSAVAAQMLTAGLCLLLTLLAGRKARRTR